MRRDLVWLLLPLLIMVAVAPPAAAAKPGDDDLLGNIGNSPAPQQPPKPSTPVVTPAPPPGSPPPQAPASATPATPHENTNPGVTATSQPGVVDRVKSVPRKELLKRHRLELSPMAGLSLNDPFYLHLSVGGDVVFYPHDAFGIGVGAEVFYLHGPTSAIDAVREGLISVPAQFDMPRLFAHLDFYWLPIYGKISFYNSSIVNFDIYTSAGVGAVTAFGSRTSMEVNFAVGQHYALTQWLALKFEVRDHVWLDIQRTTAPGQAAAGFEQSSIQNYVMLMLGVSFFVPPTFEYSFQ